MLPDFSMLQSGNKVRLGRVAERQWGRVTWAQIKHLGMPESTISLWVKDGYLHPTLPRVYAVGHAAVTLEARLAEALLYAGPGAMLSHATAAWWLRLLDDEPKVIHVSTPRQLRSTGRVRVHGRRSCERVWERGLTTTTLTQTFLDLAATSSLTVVRRSLATADYKGVLDLAEIEAALGKGRRGATRLRRALERHRPELALTKSRLERMFLEICEQQGWPTPEVNEYVAGWQVDALWRDRGIAIELDGYGNHHTPAQLKRDRRKELALRRAGFTPIRYSREQLKARTEVVADLAALRNMS